MWVLVNIDCGQQYNVACFSMTPLRENGGKSEGGKEKKLSFFLN